jgi:hypothetical protein
MGREFAAFISYSSRYKEWVRCLQANLELALAAHGETRKVFLDQTDLGAGQSWVAGLQAGFDQADQLILVVTPEALASPRVADEVEPFVAENRDWVGRLQLAVLVDAPLPPILSRIQKMDFEGHDATKYRGALSKLLGGVLGERGGRRQPALPQGIEIPDPPAGQAPREARRRLVKWDWSRLSWQAILPPGVPLRQRSSLPRATMIAWRPCGESSTRYEISSARIGSASSLSRRWRVSSRRSIAAARTSSACG